MRLRADDGMIRVLFVFEQVVVGRSGDQLLTDESGEITRFVFPVASSYCVDRFHCVLIISLDPDEQIRVLDIVQSPGWNVF